MLVRAAGFVGGCQGGVQPDLPHSVSSGCSVLGQRSSPESAIGGRPSRMANIVSWSGIEAGLVVGDP